METGSGSCLSDRNIKIVFVCALSHRCSWRSPGRRYIRISGISVHPGHFLQNKTRRGRTMSEVKNKKKKSSKKKKGSTKTSTSQNTGTSYGIYLVRDNKKIAKWGTLLFTDEINSPDIGKLIAQALLKLYSHEKRTLTISGVIGNSKVRGGSLVPVILDLGDLKIANYMLVEKVTHTFKNREYTMDLVVSGGDFSE